LKRESTGPTGRPHKRWNNGVRGIGMHLDLSRDEAQSLAQHQSVRQPTAKTLSMADEGNALTQGCQPFRIGALSINELISGGA